METSGTPPVRAAMVQAEDGTWVPLTGGVGPTTHGDPQKIGLMAIGDDGRWAPWGGTAGTVPPDVIAAADAKYVKKAGDVMTGNLTMGTAHTSDPASHTNAFIVYDGTHKMGIDASGDGLEGKAGFDASTGRLNVFTGHQDNVIALRVGEVDRVLITKRGAEVVTGHSVYIEGQSIEERYLKTTGGKVTGELEVEGSLHIHGDGDVDTPKLIIKDQDSDERYLLRTEYIPPTGSASSATIGDVKSAFLLSDHGGWVCLNGRPILDLTATQQEACLTLGFAVNLPNAANAVLMQAGTMGVVSGSNSRTLTVNQMPRHFHTVPAITNDQGVHGFGDMVNPASGRAYPLTIMRGSAEIININNQNPDSGHMPNYGRTMEDAGNDEAFDITPMSLAVNMFVYLGA